MRGQSHRLNVLPLETGITYGPIHSRRLGYSLGINLLPVTHKVCSFNCIYCYYGRACPTPLTGHTEVFPDVAQVHVAGNQILRALQERPVHVDAITFSGNGEPTLHPYFHAAVTAVKQLRDTLAPDAKLALFSNASTLQQPYVMQSLAHINLPLLKLDAGDETTFTRINRPAPGITLAQIIAGLKQAPNLTLQSILMDGEAGNLQEPAFSAWLAALVDIRPARVQLYSTDRPVAEAGIEWVPPFKLRRIAKVVREETGIEIQVYGA